MSLIAALSSLLLLVPVQTGQAQAQHQHDAGEYENDQSGAQELKISVRVVIPAVEGKLSTCIDAEGFGLCNDRDITAHDLVQSVEMSAGAYSIPAGSEFNVCC